MYDCQRSQVGGQNYFVFVADPFIAVIMCGMPFLAGFFLGRNVERKKRKP
jgi:hypothetical protein